MSSSVRTATSSPPQADSGTAHVFVNGERHPLLEDFRLALPPTFPEGTVLFDPSYVPARRVPLGTSGDELGVTRRKLLPNGHYHAFFEDSTSGALYPFSRGSACVYVMNLPFNTTPEMLGHFFESFGKLALANVEHGRTTPCNGHGWVQMLKPEIALEVPRVMEFFPKHYIYTELSDRDPASLARFGPLSAANNATGHNAGSAGSAGNTSGSASSPPAAGSTGTTRPTQWQPPAPATAAQHQQQQFQQQQQQAPPPPLHPRVGPFAVPTSPVSPDGVPKPTNPNLPQPRSSKLAAAAAAGAGPALPLPRGLAGSPTGTGGTAVGGSVMAPAPRSAFAQTGQRPPGLGPIGGVNEPLPVDADGPASLHSPHAVGGSLTASPVGVVPPRSLASSLAGSSTVPHAGSSTVYLVSFIPDAEASAAVRDSVFWPSPDMQQELQRAEEKGVVNAVILFLLQSHPAVFGYGRLPLPYRHGMTRNGLCRIEWVRHHLAIREHTLRNLNAHAVLKACEGSVVQPAVAISVCEAADAATPTSHGGSPSHVNDGSFGSMGRGRSAVGPPPPTGIYSPPVLSPVSPVGARGPRATTGGPGGAPLPMMRSGPATEGLAIPIPASRRAQAAAAAAAQSNGGSPLSPLTAKDTGAKSAAGRADAPLAHTPGPAPVL